MLTSAFYRIQVVGPFTNGVAAWFEDLTIRPGPGRRVVLLTPAIDQTALHGILAILRDLAIPLVAVQQCAVTPDCGDLAAPPLFAGECG